MDLHTIVMGCIVAFMIALAIRMHMMHSEINWLRSHLLRQAMKDDEAPGNSSTKHRSKSREKTSVAQSRAANDPPSMYDANPRQMVESIIGSTIPNDVRDEDDVRDSFDDADDDDSDASVSAEDEDNEDSDAMQMMKIMTMRASMSTLPAGAVDDERITDITPEAVAPIEGGANVDDDGDSILLEDEAPPE